MKLQLASVIFEKRFPDAVIAVNIGHAQSPHRALGHIKQQKSKKKKNLKNSKKLTT